MLASRITTILALVPAAVFWLMVTDYARGGSGSDQLIKAGMAWTAICIAVPLALASLGLLAWEHSRKQSGLAANAALAVLNVLIVASTLIYLA
jgi:hypothetical protein